MYTGSGRLLQGEQRTEIGQGEWGFESVSSDVRVGEMTVNAPLGARLESREGLVIETNVGERFDLAEVWHVGYEDKSASDLAYHRWKGKPRTEITIKFRVATKQKHWRSSLLAAGIP